jgi:hypothetical protein
MAFFYIKNTQAQSREIESWMQQTQFAWNEKRATVFLRSTRSPLIKLTFGQTSFRPKLSERFFLSHTRLFATHIVLRDK